MMKGISVSGFHVDVCVCVDVCIFFVYVCVYVCVCVFFYVWCVCLRVNEAKLLENVITDVTEVCVCV